MKSQSSFEAHSKLLIGSLVLGFGLVAFAQLWRAGDVSEVDWQNESHQNTVALALSNQSIDRVVSLPKSVPSPASVLVAVPAITTVRPIDESALDNDTPSASNGENESKRAEQPASDSREQVEGCQLGDPVACTYAAADYLEREDWEASLPYLNKGCSSNFALACTLRGFALEEIGNHSESQASFLSGCDLGHGAACYELAMLESGGNSPGADHPMVIRGCALGDGDSCLLIGDAKLAEGHQAQAMVSYRASCLDGVPQACFKLGQAYSSKKVHAKAAEVLERGCQRSEPESCLYAGIYFWELGETAKSIEFLKNGCQASAQGSLECKALADAQHITAHGSSD